MAVWVCGDCTAAYSVGAPKCPQCGSTNREEGVPDGVAAAGGHPPASPRRSRGGSGKTTNGVSPVRGAAKGGSEG